MLWSWQTQIQWLLVLVLRQESKAPGPEIEPQLAGLGRDGTARSTSCLGIAVRWWSAQSQAEAGICCRNS